MVLVSKVNLTKKYSHGIYFVAKTILGAGDRAVNKEIAFAGILPKGTA